MAELSRSRVVCEEMRAAAMRAMDWMRGRVRRVPGAVSARAAARSRGRAAAPGATFRLPVAVGQGPEAPTDPPVDLELLQPGDEVVVELERILDAAAAGQVDAGKEVRRELAAG